MTIEEGIKEAVEEVIAPLEEKIEALEEAEEAEQTPDFLVPEHEHPWINERLSVLETRCDGMDSRLFALEIPPTITEEVDIMPEPEPEPELEEEAIIDSPETVEEEEKPEEEPEVIEEDTKAPTWYERFFGKSK